MCNCGFRGKKKVEKQTQKQFGTQSVVIIPCAFLAKFGKKKKVSQVKSKVMKMVKV